MVQHAARIHCKLDRFFGFGLMGFHTHTPPVFVIIFTNNPIRYNHIVLDAAGIIRGLVSFAFENSLFDMNALPTIIDGLWKDCEMQGWAGYFYSMKFRFLKSKLIAQQNLCPHGLLRELCMTGPICWLDYHSCQYTLGHFPCLFQIELFCVSVFHFRSFVSEKK